mgnify:CR=1 FL=1
MNYYAPAASPGTARDLGFKLADSFHNLLVGFNNELFITFIRLFIALNPAFLIASSITAGGSGSHVV